MISQFIADNDKEPCWDGHLYLYADGIRDKEHLQGRVPVQIKGTEVDRFVTKKWKFKLEKADLKAYLDEPIKCNKMLQNQSFPDWVSRKIVKI